MDMGLFNSYCIDTSSIIELKHYPREFFSSLWEEIEELVGQTSLIAPREVYRELEHISDDIHQWAKNNKIMFQDMNHTEQMEVKKLLSNYKNFVNYNKTTPEADPFVIALAKHRNCTVITQEKIRTSGRPKIPNICQDYGIKCIDLFGFFRDQKWSFRLEK